MFFSLAFCQNKVTGDHVASKCHNIFYRNFFCIIFVQSISTDTRVTKPSHHTFDTLGTFPIPNLDVFLEKVQTAFDPPPPRFWILHCAFFATICIGDDPPPLPPLFGHFSPKFTTKKYRFRIRKNLQWNFLDQKWPLPPPLFPNNIHFGEYRHPLIADGYQGGARQKGILALLAILRPILTDGNHRLPKKIGYFDTSKSPVVLFIPEI